MLVSYNVIEKANFDDKMAEILKRTSQIYMLTQLMT